MPGYNSPVESYHSVNIDGVSIVILAGGVGGARLVDGFAQILPSANLTVIVNTGDDFRHMGLAISPDLDTVMYTLAGEANLQSGWGRQGETWRTIDEVARLGGPDWFRLGDLDLATHLTRTALLDQGMGLTAATAHLCQRFGLAQRLLPMSDDPAPTMIETDGGLLPFQTWFVEQAWQPDVRQVHLPADVRATPAVLSALEKANVVILAPSNPFVSIDPILNVYPIRAMIADLPDLVVAVSPIVGGEALKGPAARMMRAASLEVSARGVAEYYEDLVDLFVYDRQDAALFDSPALMRDEASAVYFGASAIMADRAARQRLAREIIDKVMELTSS